MVSNIGVGKMKKQGEIDGWVERVRNMNGEKKTEEGCAKARNEGLGEGGS